MGSRVQALVTRKTLALHATAFFRAEQLPVWWGTLGLRILTDLGSSPQGPRARHLRAPCPQFLHLQNGPESRNKAAGGPQGAEWTRPGCASAGRMLAGWRARRTGAKGPQGGGGGRARANSPSREGEGEGRGGARRVASRTARCRLLQPSLVEPAPPWRARPLHKRPPRQRRRTPTRSDPLREEENAQRRQHSPPRCCRKSPPPSLPPLPPLTGNSCGLRATELAAVPVPPYGLPIGSDSPTPPVTGQRPLSLTAPLPGTPPYARPPVTFKPWRPTSAPPLPSPAGPWIGDEAGGARPWRTTTYSLVSRAPRGPQGPSRGPQ